MKQISIKGFSQKVPALVVGCMRQAGFTDQPFSAAQMNHFIHTAVENGANFFDHADIYGLGNAEKVFGEAWSSDPNLRREDLIIQDKCGICRGYYDSSKEHIIEAVEGSLRNLKTDYLDILLLHRPDALIEPEEVAEAFDLLEKSGKVRAFGVSNYRSYQIQLLQKYMNQKLIVNQMEMSIVHSGMIAQGMESNMTTENAADRDGQIIDFCRYNDITIQTWSPFQISLHGGTFIGSEQYPELNAVLDELAEKYNTTPTAIAEAWILRHPAQMQVLAGTSREDRLLSMIQATEIELTRQEWYRLYLAAGHILP